jgi:hypothetical protein
MASRFQGWRRTPSDSHRLDELSYLRHSKGLLDEEIWTARKRVIELDLSMPEFREAWAERCAPHRFARPHSVNATGAS